MIKIRTIIRGIHFSFYKINEKIEYCQTIRGQKIKLRSSLIIIICIYIAINSYGNSNDTALSSGIDLFLNNNPEAAVVQFKIALSEDAGNNKIYNYLGIAYEQLGENGKAIDIYKKGLKNAGGLKSIFLTNIANNLAILGDFDNAIDYYTQAINLDNNADALRNRAGEYLRKQFYSEALADYKLYLKVESKPYQEKEIRNVIALLSNKMDELASKKLEDERKRLEEEARQKELLSQVLDSLNTAGDDTTNLSAGTESAQDYSTDFDIVE